VRVTEQSKYGNLLSRVQQNQSRLQNAIDQISSGRRVEHASDDPTAAAQIDRLDRASARHEKWLEVGRDKESELMATDAALSAVNELLVRGREIGMVFGSGVHSPEQLEAAADEVAGLREQLVNAANTEYDGRYLFSGVAEDTPAFSDAGAYQGSATQREVEVGYGASIAQADGNAIFGGAGGGVDAFQALTDLENALRAGDQNAVRNQIDTVRSAHGQVNDARQRVGIDLETIEMSRAFSENVVLQNAVRADELESTDIAKASTQLAQANTALQAIAEAASRMNDMSTLLRL
jgi:flagellar hook-associated protein 3 FlgL